MEGSVLSLMKKNNLFTLIIASLCLSSCSFTDSNVGSTIITDMIGRNISINAGSYKRVACIGAGALRLYSYIGDLSLLCGVEDIDNYALNDRPKMFDDVARPYVLANKDYFYNLPSVGRGGPNAQIIENEKILSTNPDIIISEYEDADKALALEKQIGVPVVTVAYGNKGVFDENISKSLTLLGEIFNKNERAKLLNDFIEKEKNTISEITGKIDESSKKNVYICGLGNYGTTNHLMTAQNYEPFNVAHVKNIVSDLPIDGIQKIEEEKFISLGNNMDIMIFDAAAIKNIIPLYKQDNNLFSSCKAFKTGEVYLEMAYNAYYTNIEIALANTWFIAKSVYPESFTDLNIDDKLNEITKVFLGKELKDDIYNSKFSYGGYQKINIEEFFK